MNNPLVSIIIPVYNAEKYLEETILSAIAQTWTNKEIIIVDDGSVDNSLAIARQYENSWIKVFVQQNNGASAARNTGLREAKGDYIQFLDADDLLSVDKIANQFEFLEKNPGKLVVCSTIHFNDGEDYESSLPSPYEEVFLLSNDDPVHFLINLWGGFSENGSMIQPNAWLTPKNIIETAGLWNEEITVDDDGEFFCRVVLQSKGIVKSGGYNYYRKHNNRQSLSAQKSIAGITSKLKAAVLKKRALLAGTNSFGAHVAIYKSLINIAADSYLKYPQIYNEAISELPKIKLNYQPAMGGPISNKLASIFGWRMIKLLKLYR